MSAHFFADTWRRAQIQRKSPAWRLSASLYPLFEPCPLDPTRPNAHPASVIERGLMELSEEAFNAAQPAECAKIKADQPALTGVAWIDEQERARYK
jgi:hypothetical protein